MCFNTLDKKVTLTDTIIASQGSLQENCKKNSERQPYKSQVQFWKDLGLPVADLGLNQGSPHLQLLRP